MGWLGLILKGPGAKIQQNSIILGRNAKYCPPERIAAVIVATEPLWASVFGLVLLREGLGTTDTIGGALVIAACIVSSAEPSAVRGVLPVLPTPQDGEL